MSLQADRGRAGSPTRPGRRARRARPTLFVLLLAVTAHAEVARPTRPVEERGGWCATSDATSAEIERLDRWTRAREHPRKSIALNAAADVRQENGIHVVTATPAMIPFHDPVDLAGTSIRFERLDAQSFRVSQVPLQYDESIGIPITATTGTRYDLTLLSLPFYGRTLNAVWIADLFAVYADAPSGGAKPRQYGPVELLSESAAAIAPLLLPSRPPGWGSAVRSTYVRESSDAVTITWRAGRNATAAPVPETDPDVDIQARLQSDGTIVFSYRSVENLSWGGVTLNPGGDPWAAARETLVSAADAPGDTGATQPFRDMTDLRGVEISRVGGSDLLDIRVQLGAKLSPQTVPSDGSVLSVQLSDGLGNSDQLNVWIDRDEFFYCPPAWSCTSAEGTIRFADDGIWLRVLEEQLTVQGSNLQVRVYTWDPTEFSDGLSTSLTRGVPSRRAEADLASLDAPSTLTGTIAEAFTLPVLNPSAVWARMKAVYGVEDAEVDGLAIYQAFPTDIVFYAGAYSTVGNAGADGVAVGRGNVGSDRPRTPALLHMNRVFLGRADDDRYSLRVLGHELGHRWLTHMRIMEDGVATRSMNPVSSHPAAYVHMPAAFPAFFESNESSTMGGGYFTEGPAGFSTGMVVNSGFAWNELYLMGLAAPAEVPPWFYIANSSPALPREYYPPSNTFVTGTKVNVGVDQIIAATGARHPASEYSQKRFRTLFVLLELPETPASAAQSAKVGAFAANFAPYFDRATGSRGSTIATLPVTPSASFTPSPLGNGAYRFRDTSSDYPTSWSWSFGDGTTSTDQHPQHTYSSSGTYTVTLTVRNSKGSSSTSQAVSVGSGGRRRGVRS